MCPEMVFLFSCSIQSLNSPAINLNSTTNTGGAIVSHGRVVLFPVWGCHNSLWLKNTTFERQKRGYLWSGTAITTSKTTTTYVLWRYLWKIKYTLYSLCDNAICQLACEPGHFQGQIKAMELYDQSQILRTHSYLT